MPKFRPHDLVQFNENAGSPEQGIVGRVTQVHDPDTLGERYTVRAPHHDMSYGGVAAWLDLIERAPNDPPREFPGEAIISKEIGQWPIKLDDPEHESIVAGEMITNQRRRAWRVRIDYIEELVAVPPTRPTLKPKGTDQ